MSKQTIRYKALTTKVLSQVLCSQPTASLQQKDKIQAPVVPYMGGGSHSSQWLLVSSPTHRPITARQKPSYHLSSVLLQAPPKPVPTVCFREAQVTLAQASRGSGTAWCWALLVAVAAGPEATAFTMDSPHAQAYLNMCHLG